MGDIIIVENVLQESPEICSRKGGAIQLSFLVIGSATSRLRGHAEENAEENNATTLLVESTSRETVVSSENSTLCTLDAVRGRRTGGPLECKGRSIDLKKFYKDPITPSGTVLKSFRT